MKPIAPPGLHTMLVLEALHALQGGRPKWHQIPVRRSLNFAPFDKKPSAQDWDLTATHWQFKTGGSAEPGQDDIPF